MTLLSYGLLEFAENQNFRFQVNLSKFKGKKILFVHTGGCLELLSDSGMMSHLEKLDAIDRFKLL